MKHKRVWIFQVLVVVLFLLGSTNLQLVFAQDEAPQDVVVEESVVEPDVPQEEGQPASPEGEVTDEPIEILPTDSPTEAPVEPPVETETPVETESPVEVV